mmetsp:Transcript_11517/g.24275  ORF Transcript_11517/g.24275 Transcript_11517/m.24275 type:complete len:285 (+) Transcript_11517:97-951(+)
MFTIMDVQNLNWQSAEYHIVRRNSMMHHSIIPFPNQPRYPGLPEYALNTISIHLKRQPGIVPAHHIGRRTDDGSASFLRSHPIPRFRSRNVVQYALSFHAAPTPVGTIVVGTAGESARGVISESFSGWPRRVRDGCCRFCVRDDCRGSRFGWNATFHLSLRRPSFHLPFLDIAKGRKDRRGTSRFTRFFRFLFFGREGNGWSVGLGVGMGIAVVVRYGIQAVDLDDDLRNDGGNGGGGRGGGDDSFGGWRGCRFSVRVHFRCRGGAIRDGGRDDDGGSRSGKTG